MDFLTGITTLLIYQLIGEVAARLLSLNIPGPVLGMILLFLSLLLLRRTPHFLGFTANHLLSHLSLLFVPAGVGVITHLQRIGSEWLPIVSSLFVGTFVSMAVTAWSMQWLVRRFTRENQPHE